MNNQASQTVLTSSGPYSFVPVPLFHGRKVMEPVQAGENLTALKQIFDCLGLRFGIIYGTLLGAVRDGAFIAWDEDVDVYMVDEDRPLLHDALWRLRERGFELVRHEGDLYSVMRNDEYIDIYVFRLRGGRRWCNADVLDAKFVNFRSRVPFLETEFFAPDEPQEFLRVVYGAEWRTPMRDRPARPWSAMRKGRNVLKRVLPFLPVWRDHVLRFADWLRSTRLHG